MASPIDGHLANTFFKFPLIIRRDNPTCICIYYDICCNTTMIVVENTMIVLHKNTSSNA